MPPAAEAPRAEAPSLPHFSGRQAIDVLACSYPRLRALAAEGRIRVYKLPGGWPRYSAEDVLKLRDEMG